MSTIVVLDEFAKPLDLLVVKRTTAQHRARHIPPHGDDVRCVGDAITTQHLPQVLGTMHKLQQEHDGRRHRRFCM